MVSQTAISFPTVDFSSFTKDGNIAGRSKAAQELVKACSEHGFVAITGHGVPDKLLEEAFAWSKKLFDLPHEEKMKAPHPASSVPHRGYSHPGLEKVISKNENADAASSNGASVRKIMDFKESYEIGSDDGPQGNIWLPSEVLPGFRTFMTRFYWECNKAACTFLDAVALGLDLSKSEIEYVKQLHSGHNNQLRLLHYPPIPAEMLDTQVLARMPAHEDWSTFTILFQDSCGGLELQSTSTGTFVPATPVPGACVVNIGDMFERLSNGTFHSPLHRVALPPFRENHEGGSKITQARYSIPYFVAPDDDGVVRCLGSRVGEGRKEGYVPVTFREYGMDRGRYHYQGGR